MAKPDRNPPSVATSEALAGVARLAAIMARLRGPGGCEWDRAQNFASIAPYTIEEAYEVADAIAAGDMAALAEELGDLLLQVIFHTQMAAEAGHFTLQEVADGICNKLERRHPHIFGGDGRFRHWEDIKAEEKPRASPLDGVARALPALLRATKLLDRAERSGLPAETGEKLLAELRAADAGERERKVGDRLLSLAAAARRLGVNPETALRLANDRFERRCRAAGQAPARPSPVPPPSSP